MEQGAAIPWSWRRRGRVLSPHDKRFFAIALAIVAVLSPLYVNNNNNKPGPDAEEDLHPDIGGDHSIYYYTCSSSYLPLLLLILIIAIAISGYLERGGLNRLDPYWIHRLVGSSVGIVFVLIILTLVLNCKAASSAIIS
ncbi:uncharacterized protein LOC127265688 [Andrographis paniculata]|uniref:uncharacterized protein LOC127265688 n=1 Tax=Andrographis paniculata TaxID=175694 RepID=UPI0021E81262|nr:uncharacterized protein LOC127265688 [Andrographis paniculata]